ncbi:hypothetical protein H4R20_001521 [Coemansia guatemalensis]|uniref:DUF1751-domain-containing protein n=1 Tax=Coemansia guatemalensis TaxID=2761395 RepID=A0A9W8I5P5_9FUNG|nr:hypothetical protein H4R20_001521 [Coemansia guatemalensis]
MSALLLHLRGLPVATKLVSAVSFTLSVAALVLRLRSAPEGEEQGSDSLGSASVDPARYLVLRPGFVISYPWTLVTAAFVEPNPVFLLCGLLTLVTIGCFLERQWGVRSYAAFLLVVAVVPALTATGLVILLYALGGGPELLYKTQIGGLAGVLSGFTVGLKQLVPDYNVKLLRGKIGFRVNDLPGVYTLVAPILFSLLGDLGGVLLVNIGFLESFVYLRFYKRTGAVRGDRSEAFAFCTFFPEFIQPVIRRLSDLIYRLAVACKVITSDEGYRQQQQDVDLEIGGISRAVEDVQTGAETSDADRRRALAAKALDMRLGGSDSPASRSETTPPTEDTTAAAASTTIKADAS